MAQNEVGAEGDNEVKQTANQWKIILVVDRLLALSVHSQYILDRLLLHIECSVEHAQRLHDQRLRAFARFINYSECNWTIIRPDFVVSAFSTWTCTTS